VGARIGENDDKNGDKNKPTKNYGFERQKQMTSNPFSPIPGIRTLPNSKINWG
jgi:hypothetical protein